MNDLVKRLRAKCKLLHQCVEMRREAADEIERLRHALKRIIKENADIHCEEIALAALEDDDE